MSNKNQKTTRPPLTTLACVNPDCELHGQAGQDNLIVRKVYGKDQMRYRRCRECREEFSERKGTALWNTKIPEAKAVSVSEHLAEGCSQASISRLVKVDKSTVRRLTCRVGQHAEVFHDEQVQDVAVDVIQADERHGFAGNKQRPMWEAEIMDPESKLVLSYRVGPRNESLIRALLEDGASRLADRHDVVLMTDGLDSYKTLFPEIFGHPYQPPRKNGRGRSPKIQFRIPRQAAHVQVIKKHVGRRLVDITVRMAHGTQKRVHQSLMRLGYTIASTAFIERRNATARLMNRYQVRKSIAFARRDDTKHVVGWWNVTVYNWCRPHRGLRIALTEPQGKKSLLLAHLL